MVVAQVVSGSLVIKSAADELRTVLSDLYRRVARNRPALKVIDRCAAEYPELASIWFNEGRWAQHRLLVELIRARGKRRSVRRLEDPEVIARTSLETLAFWAMHRHLSLDSCTDGSSARIPALGRLGARSGGSSPGRSPRPGDGPRASQFLSQDRPDRLQIVEQFSDAVRNAVEASVDNVDAAPAKVGVPQA